MYHDALPSPTNLVRRGVPILNTCQRCSVMEESSARSCAFLLPSCGKKSGNMLVSTWCIWNDRNGVLHGNGVRDASNIGHFATTFLAEFQGCKLDRMINSTDAALNNNLQIVGTGRVVRDHDGVVVACLAAMKSGLVSVEVAELLAIQETLRFSAANGWTISRMESDSLRAVQAIASRSPLAPSANIISNIIRLFSQVNCGSCHFVPHLRNRVAHLLAKVVYNSSRYMF
ncbi:Ribonuclease H-like domain containing protein [Trema orientale]|uniref:Ribonuclease H-like domain containing protein n=1 Tax=Trema orientale TaxID=63057 RepID=A0A2P5BGE7_TREOI|nr:Ribonuclease H-like domain containing protein [Trema orientale]